MLLLQFAHNIHPIVYHCVNRFLKAFFHLIRKLKVMSIFSVFEAESGGFTADDLPCY